MLQTALLSIVTISLIFGVAYAANDSELVPIGNSMALERTVLNFEISSDNILPWGYVEGHVKNHAAGYPVIIQIYSDNSPVHFAQADVAEDGTYEYKFRVRNVNNGQAVNIFDGGYSVVISKVIDLSKNSHV